CSENRCELRCFGRVFERSPRTNGSTVKRSFATKCRVCWYPQLFPAQTPARSGARSVCRRRTGRGRYPCPNNALKPAGGRPPEIDRGRCRGSLLAHTSPLGWSHINLTGDYLWEQAAIAVDGFRPLNVSRAASSRSRDRMFVFCPS